jgi:hypothetical protein
MPVASTDATWTPELATIQLQADRGVLLATATDRFVAAHARAEADGTLAACLLKLADAKLLMTHLRAVVPIKGIPYQVELSLADGRLSVKTRAAVLSFEPGDPALWPTSSVKKVFTGGFEPKTGQPPALGRVDLGNGPLATVNRVLAATAKGLSTRWRTTRPNAPILVDVDDWLLIAIMPMRIVGDQHVMFGLPEPEPKPARVRKVAAKAEPAKVPAARRRAS